MFGDIARLQGGDFEHVRQAVETGFSRKPGQFLGMRGYILCRFPSRYGHDQPLSPVMTVDKLAHSECELAHIRPVFGGQGQVICNGCTFSGSTGSTSLRYALKTLGLIDTVGGGASYLPGDTAGTTDGNGGIYA